MIQAIRSIDAKFIRLFFALSLPAILYEVVNLVGTNVSTAMLGAFSAKAIAGYSVSSQAFDIYSMVILGLTGAFHVFIAQYFGAQDRRAYNQVFRVGVRFSLAAGTLCALAFMVFAGPFSRLFLSDPETLDYAVPWLRIFSLSFIPYALNLMASGMYTILGQAKISFAGAVIDCAVNLVTLPLLMSGPAGANGAAWSLLLARWAETVFLYGCLARKNSPFRLHGQLPRMKRRELVRILGAAVPLILNECVFAAGMFVVFLDYSRIGEQYLACLPVVTLVTSLVFAPSKGAGAVIGVLVGQALGRGELDRARADERRILAVSSGIVLAGCLCILALSGVIPKLFSLEGDLFEMARTLLVIKAVCSALGSGVTMVFYNILRIGGNTMEVLVYDGLYILVAVMGTSLILTWIFHSSFVTVFAGVEGATMLKACWGEYLVHRGKWMRQIGQPQAEQKAASVR